MEDIVEILKSFIPSLPMPIKIIITIILVVLVIYLFISKKSDSENKNSGNKINFKDTTINGDFHIGDKNDGQKK